MEIIPNKALVVRGGRNRPQDIQRATGTHPSGITGISVECALGLSVAELTLAIPHGQVGVTTVGEVRSEGGDAIRTSGRSPNHPTLTLKNELNKLRHGYQYQSERSLRHLNLNIS